MAKLTCPHCGKDMDQMDHGRCSYCKEYCGCSFNPVTVADHCGYHNMQLNHMNQRAQMCGCGFAHKASERCGPW